MKDVVEKQYATFKFSSVLARFLNRKWVDIYAVTPYGKGDYKDLMNRRVYEKVSSPNVSKSSAVVRP